jgi:hypothetical protein
LKPETTKRSRGRRALFTCLAIGILGWVPASNTRAEPYLAIQEGFKCSTCHVNMTGGGKRTDFGNIYAQTRLASKFFDWRSAVAGAGEDADKDNPPKTDFRALYGQTRTPGRPTTDAFNQRKHNVYLEVDLVPDHVVFYQTFPGGGDAQEIFGLLKGEVKGQPIYLKAGQFFLPYGLRLQDDTAFTRAVTGFTYGTVDVGVELGFEPGPWALHVAATNGTGSSLETNRSKKATSSLAYVHKRFRLGGSYSRSTDAQGVETKISGVNGGTQLGRLGILAEADVVEDPTVKQRISILEFNFLVTRERYSLVYEPFLYQFTQVRVGYRDRRGIPQNAGFNANEFFAELHLFF